MPGPTLGIRRVQCDRRSDLFNLKTPIPTIQKLINVKGYKYFIDSNGTPFYYEKTTLAKVNTYAVKSVDLRETATSVTLYGVSSPFLISAPPRGTANFCTVLEIAGIPWLPLDFYEFKSQIPKIVRRRI